MNWLLVLPLTAMLVFCSKEDGFDENDNNTQVTAQESL